MAVGQVRGRRKPEHRLPCSPQQPTALLGTKGHMGRIQNQMQTDMIYVLNVTLGLQAHRNRQRKLTTPEPGGLGSAHCTYKLMRYRCYCTHPALYCLRGAVVITYSHGPGQMNSEHIGFRIGRSPRHHPVWWFLEPGLLREKSLETHSCLRHPIRMSGWDTTL